MSKTLFSENKIMFSGLSDVPTKNKSAVMGEYLWNLLFKRDPNFGGFFAGFYGIMGCGKTSLLHKTARRIMKENPDEILFWREPLESPLQAPNIRDGRFQILCERRSPVKLYRMSSHGITPSDDFKIRKFTGFNELLKMVEPGMLNVVYFQHLYRWVDLLNKLRRWRSWKSVFFDELEDVLPGRCRGKQWLMNEVFANSVKEIRKSRTNVFYTTQNQMDIDYRCVSKTMLHFYLYGAKRDEHSPVFKQAVQGLKLGQGWVDYGHSLFGQINFKPVLPLEPTYMVLSTGGNTKKS